MRRFFVDPEAIVSDRATLMGPDVRHIRTVLRLKPGDEVLLFDGNGSEYRARIESSTSGQTVCTVLERSASESESPVEITIGQGVIKGRKMDQVVRQVTELGIFALIPVMAERSVPRPKSERWGDRERRWKAIAVEALKQCGRAKRPTLGPPVAFEEIIASSQHYDSRVIFHHEGSGLPPHDAGQVRSVLALVGPEGGFTADEMGRAIARGFQAVSLGPRTLKADTAVVAACTILQYAFGDIGGRRVV